MRRRIQGVVALGLFWVAGIASAEPTVAVLTASEGPERPGFVEALRIQLAGSAAVTPGGVLASGTQSERVEAAVEATRRAGATVSVWVEGPVVRADGRRELVVYVVGEARGRAVMEVVRTPAERSADRPDPAVDRSLALKVRALLGDLATTRGVLKATVVAPGQALPVAEQDVAEQDVAEQDAAEPPREDETQPERSKAAEEIEQRQEEPPPSEEGEHRRSTQVRVEIGPLAAVGSDGVRLGARVGAGARLAWPSLGMEIVARADWFAPSESTSADGRVEISQLAPGIEVRGDTRLDALRIGGFVGTELRILAADGTTSGGTTGSASEIVPALLAGPYIALPLGPVFEARLALGASLALREQRFALNRVPIAEAGRLRATAALLLGAEFP